MKPATPPAPVSGSAPSPAATAPASMDASACTNSSKPEPTQAKFANAPGFVVPAPSFSYTVLSNASAGPAAPNEVMNMNPPNSPSIVQPPVPGLSPPTAASFSFGVSQNVASIHGKHLQQTSTMQNTSGNVAPDAGVSSSASTTSQLDRLPGQPPQKDVVSNIGPASAWTTSLRPFSLSTGIPGTPGLPGPPGLTPPASVSSHPVLPSHTSDPSTSSLRPNIVVGPVATNPGVQPQVYSAYPSMPPMAANPQALWLQPPQMSGMAPPPFVAYLAVLPGPFPFPAHGMPISSIPSPDPQPPGVTPEGSAGGMSSSSVPGWLVAGNSATQTEVQPLADDTSKHVSGRNEAAANEQLDAWTARKADSGVVYYYNVLTGESTYEKPACFKGELDNVASKAAPISIANISEGGQSCAYSSEGDGRNASYGKQEPPKDGCSADSGKSTVKQTATDVGTGRDSHARLGEQDLKEWLHIAKLAIERKKKDPSLLSRREKFKNEFLRRIIPWEEISVSWETFPYYINEHTKNTLVECVASHMKHKKINSSHGARLNSSSGRILLQSIPGTELFRERLVSALARDLQVPLLVLDSPVFAPYDFGEDCSSAEEENEATSDGSDDEADVPATAEAALKKIVPFDLEDFAKRVSGDSKSSSEPSKPKDVANSEQPKHQLKRGDHVKYIGPSGKISADNRPLSTGQRGVVYEVNLDRVAVFLDTNKNKASGDAADETSTEQSTPPIYWISVDDIEPDLDSHAEDCYTALEALCEVLRSPGRLVVYFPDSSQWLSRTVTKANRSKIVNKVHEMFGQLPGPVVLVCGQNIVETGWKEREKFTMIHPNIGRPAMLNNLTDGLRANHKAGVDSIHKLCNNILRVDPPEEEHLRKTFDKQVEEDRKIIISRSNINELNQVLEKHELSCVDHLHVNTEGVILTGQKAEKVIGWARNHYLSSCVHPAIKGDRLCLPRESLEVAIVRLKEQEAVSQETSLNFKNLAKDYYERNFVSAVVPPGEVGVRFDDVGALEDVKEALNELVILPMRRPELFSHGNLLRPCKGMLLFGPPGTGKTLLAKALATEAGANFISITGSTMTSKWYGEAEKFTKALFSFASRLAPVVIFIDEVDSLLGARGGSCEHEATRRMRNEFLAAWDGLRSNDKERVLILGATNRPFDLDDAVIRRLPRRLYVDLPDAENRKKILKIILGQENLEHGFEIDELASMTEGYSGSDLKNLCITAAYRPVQELLEEEKKGSKNSSPTPRPLRLDDFLQSKSKVTPSVASDSASMNKLRKWNEQYGEGGNRRKSPFGV